MALGCLGEDVGGLPGQSEEGGAGESGRGRRGPLTEQESEGAGGKEQEMERRLSRRSCQRRSITFISFNLNHPVDNPRPLPFDHSGQSASASSSCLSL